MSKKIDYRTAFVWILSRRIQQLLSELTYDHATISRIIVRSLQDVKNEGKETDFVVDELMKTLLQSSVRVLVIRYIRDAQFVSGADTAADWSLKSYSTGTTYRELHEHIADDRLRDVVQEAMNKISQQAWTGGTGNPASPDESRERDPVLPPASPAGGDRYLVGETKGSVHTGDVFPLTVRVTTSAAESRPGYGSAALPPLVAGNLEISVHTAGGIIFPEGSILMLDVPAAGESAPVTFTLQAVASGTIDVKISAWQGPVHVAGFSVRIAVDQPAEQQTQASSPVLLRSAEPGEFTLEIIWDASRHRYGFQLRGGQSAQTEPVYTEMSGDRLQQYEAMLGALNAQARNLSNTKPSIQANWLKGVGVTLADQLLPQELRARLWAEKGSIHRLNIFCDRDILPWELLYLKPPSTGEGFFFAERSNVARWRYGVPAPAQIQLNDFYTVNPVGSPPHTLEEVKRLQVIFKDAKVVRTIDDLDTLLNTRSFSCLHFASHNVLNPAAFGGSYVPFGNSRFDLPLMAAIDYNKFAAFSPLIFMNACTTAGTVPLFKETSSWAEQFLGLGASAFIGSLWEIVDKKAPDFAAHFYSELRSGKTLGEAMQSARLEIGKTDPGDPTRFAYTLYGNPQATVTFNTTS